MEEDEDPVWWQDIVIRREKKLLCETLRRELANLRKTMNSAAEVERAAMLSEIEGVINQALEDEALVPVGGGGKMKNPEEVLKEAPGETTVATTTATATQGEHQSFSGEKDNEWSRINGAVSAYQRCTDEMLRNLENIDAIAEAKVLSMLDADTDDDYYDHGFYDLVHRFWKYMRALGHSSEEIFTVWHRNEEIVGVAVAGTMKFDDFNALVPVGAGPFFGRLFEIACRNGNEELDELVMSVLKKLMWLPNCRHFFVPFGHKLQVIFNKESHNTQQELFTCCVNLGPLLPQVVNELCDTFVSKLSEARGLNPPFRWMNGWDVLPLHASNDVVEFLRQRNITARLITGFLKFCERFGLQEVFSTRLHWLVPNVISRVTTLCSVDTVSGHKVILQFVEDHLGSDKQLLKVVSALLMIPVIVTGGNVSESLAMQALTLPNGCSTVILGILFSIKKLFEQLSSRSVELLFEKSLETKCLHYWYDGLLFQMLKFCSDRVKDHPLYSVAARRYITQYNQEQQVRAAGEKLREGRPLSFVYSLDILSTHLQSVNYRYRSHFGMRVKTITIDLSSCFASSFMLLGSEPPVTTAQTLSSSCFSSLTQLCCLSPPSMIEENECSVASLWSHAPDRRKCMQEILGKSRNDPMKWVPLLKAMLISEIQPIAPSEPRKLPRSLCSNQHAGACNQEKIQEVLQCPTVTKCYVTVLRLLQHQVDGHADYSKVCRLMAMWPGVFKTEVLASVVNDGAYGAVCNLLPLCEPEHIPSQLLLVAMERGFRDIAELLWCHGVSIPKSTLGDGNTLKVRGEPVDSHHPSVRRFFNNTPTWDPQLHRMFPWWFKVHILRTVLLCWLRNANVQSSSPSPSSGHIGHQQPHFIGRLPLSTVRLILSFLSPVNWFD
ncbi:hypothetical protein Pelo_11840 [Pelomyxa schiedti]|nr:hypothetical protein Pelo_11840 [Pelomyxa schiedti]